MPLPTCVSASHRLAETGSAVRSMWVRATTAPSRATRRWAGCVHGLLLLVNTSQLCKPGAPGTPICLACNASLLQPAYCPARWYKVSLPPLPVTRRSTSSSCCCGGRRCRQRLQRRGAATHYQASRASESKRCCGRSAGLLNPSSATVQPGFDQTCLNCSHCSAVAFGLGGAEGGAQQSRTPMIAEGRGANGFVPPGLAACDGRGHAGAQAVAVPDGCAMFGPAGKALDPNSAAARAYGLKPDLFAREWRLASQPAGASPGRLEHAHADRWPLRCQLYKAATHGHPSALYVGAAQQRACLARGQRQVQSTCVRPNRLPRASVPALRRYCRDRQAHCGHPRDHAGNERRPAAANPGESRPGCKGRGLLWPDGLRDSPNPCAAPPTQWLAACKTSSPPELVHRLADPSGRERAHSWLPFSPDPHPLLLTHAPAAHARRQEPCGRRRRRRRRQAPAAHKGGQRGLQLWGRDRGGRRGGIPGLGHAGGGEQRTRQRTVTEHLACERSRSMGTAGPQQQPGR